MPITKLQSSRDFFRIWFFWKKTAIWIFFSIVAIVMVYAYTETPQYESVARIMLLPKNNQELILTADNDYRQGIRGLTQEDLNTEIELLMSDKVMVQTIQSFPDNELNLKIKKQNWFGELIKLIKKSFENLSAGLKLQEKPLNSLEKKVNFLRKSLRVISDDSNILKVSLIAESPKQAATVLHKVIENYIELHHSVFNIEKGVEFFDDQATLYKNKLGSAEGALKNFYEKSKIIDLQNQNAANISLFNELKKELLNKEVQYEEIKSRIESIEKGLKEPGKILLSREMRDIPSIIEFEKGIVPLIIHRTQISKTFTKTSREYKDITSQIETLRQEMRVEITRALETEKLEADALYARIGFLKQTLESVQNKAVLLKKQEMELQELQRQADLNKTTYLSYASKMEISRLYSEKNNRQLANVSMVDSPSIPSRPFSPRKMLMLIISLFLGSIAAAIVPFIFEALDQKLKSADDIEILIDLPVISSFSKV